MPPANSCQRTSSNPARTIAPASSGGSGNRLTDAGRYPYAAPSRPSSVAQQWHDAIEPELVETAQVTGRRDLQDDDATARAHHPRHLGDAAVQIADVADAEGDRRAVELVVGERQRKRVGLRRTRRARPAPLPSLAARSSMFSAKSTPTARPLGVTRRDSANARSPVPVHTSSADFARRDVGGGGGGLTPAPIQAGGHDAIEQVVAWRDTVEHRLHLRRRETPRALLARRRVAHGRTSAGFVGPDMSASSPQRASSPCGTPR